MLATLAVSVVLGLATAKPTQAEAERLWADYWVEMKVTAGGKPGDHDWHWGRSFVPDKSDGSFASWLVMGEVVLAPYHGSLQVDVTKTPMHVDYTHTGRRVPGLFLFVGDVLIWVSPKGYGQHGLDCKQMVRPTDFTSTAANGHVVRVMRPTDGLYGFKPRGPGHK